MFMKSWHPELAMLGMFVLSQVISASSCASAVLAWWPWLRLATVKAAVTAYFWSSSGCEIGLKIRNRLEPASTEKLVYVYSNSKMVAATSVADKPKIGIMKMTGRENEDDRQHSCSVTSSDPAAHFPARGPLPGSGLKRWVGESQVALFSRVASSQVAASLLGATLPTLLNPKPWALTMLFKSRFKRNDACI